MKKFLKIALVITLLLVTGDLFGQSHGWTINPAAFKYSGQVTAVVLHGTNEVTTGTLGAFFGGTCRGYADATLFPVTGKHVFTVICYSDTTNLETLTFQYYDPSDGTYYEINEDLLFVSDMIAGDALTPLQYHTLPLIYSVTGGGSYCEGGAGLPVGLTDSEIGVIYTLIKGGVSTGQTIAGTGSAISFGNQSGSTYTITGTNSGGTVTMAGNALIIEDPNAIITLTSGSYTPIECINTAVTEIVYTVTGGGTGAGVTGLPSGVTGAYNSGTFTISGTPTESGVFNFTVTTTGTCTQTSASGTITVNALPTPANAGSDQTGASMCGLTSTTLAGNTPTVGTGLWTIVSGTGGSITTPTSATSGFTGTAGTTYVLQWTISNSPCTATTDQVTITFQQNPTAALAGSDQTGSSMCGLTSTTLAGNTPTVGTGLWTIVSGTGGSITTPTSATSGFTGTAGTTYVLQWTISNSPCTATTDQVTITFQQNPTAALAGSDQTGSSMCGLTSTTLAGNTPVVGTGLWTIVSGTGGSITTPTSATSGFTGTAGTTYVLQWTISNSPCTATTDQVTITFQQNPTAALAGSDQTGSSMCGLTSTTLAGNTPVVGTGLWTIVSGTGGSITTPTSATSGFTGTAGTTYVLQWTISNSPCTATTDQVTITFQQNPTAALAGSDQTGASMCGLTSTTLAGNTPTVGTGLWTIVSGTGGSITTPTSATSGFTGTAGTTYVLQWTISNSPCTATTDQVTITFQQNPTAALAGSDQTGSSMCGLTSTTLAGNTPVVGTGLWTIVSGTGGSITTPTSATSGFTGTAGTTYVLQWTISNSPCTATTNQVTITFQQNPTAALAGSDQTGSSMCGLTSTTLAGNTPTVGTGLWTIVSGTGGSITTPTSATSGFTGTAGTTYVLQWTISNSPCTSLSDQVTITFQQNPTPANAGSDQTGVSMCGLTSTTLAGNTPVVGTGLWTIVSGTGGSITTPTSATSGFTGTAGTTYVLQWTISNSPCTATTDQVTITFQQNPTAALAGSDQTGSSMCGLTSTTLAGNTPVVGTGLWTIVSGTGGSITTPTSATSGFTGTAGTTYVLQWTISNSPCTATTDQVTITFQQNPTAALAGSDQTGSSMCGLTSTTLAGNTPTVGTGLWTIVSGTGGSITTPTSATSGFTGTAGTTYVLQWTIINSPCTSSSDDVTITFHSPPVITGTLSIFLGSTTQLSGSGIPAVSLPWVSSTPTVATISNSGLVTSVSGGTTIITYTDINGCSNSVTVTIQLVNFSKSLSAGWNWFSVNTLISNMTLANILPTVTANGDYIKNQVSSATYYTGYGWFGSLTEIDPTKLYKLKVLNSSSINYSGAPVNVNLTTIGLVSGWNWIGYLPQSVQSISNCFSSFSLSHLDYVKNQTLSATYYSGYGWFGILTDLSPSEGYMVKVVNSGTLKYPDIPGKMETALSAESSLFSFRANEFEFSGTVTAEVFVDGIAKNSENNYLLAFVDNQLRGVSGGHYFDPRGTCIFPIMIHSNKEEGEVIEFRYYDAGNDKYYSCKETLPFVKDMIVADAFKSIALNTKTDSEVIDPESNDVLEFKTYPNPFNQFLNIDYRIVEQSYVRVTIYNSTGRLVEVLVNQEQGPDNYSIKWDSSQRSEGIYFINIQTGSTQETLKVTLIK